MDPDLAVLSSTAATTLVTLMTTDAWERARSAFAGLLQRFRPSQAGALSEDLEATRVEVIAARQSGDEETERELLNEWRTRLRRLIASDEQFQRELQRLVEEFRPLASTAEPAAPVVMQARASGSGRIYQAGHDLRVTGE
jgi:hypothetical protein